MRKKERGEREGGRAHKHPPLTCKDVPIAPRYNLTRPQVGRCVISGHAAPPGEGGGGRPGQEEGEDNRERERKREGGGL